MVVTEVHNTGDVDLSEVLTKIMEEEQPSSGDWLPSNLDLNLEFCSTNVAFAVL